MNKQQSGFTLIELIMVIVILGVLSAFAVPKFANLTTDAESAAVGGALAAAKSASGITHAAYLVAGNTPATVTLEGGLVVNMVNGYPSGDNADGNGICEAAGLDTDFTCTDNNADPAVMTITKGACSFTYTEAASATAAPTFSAVTGTGC